jgi:hypothetical protein
MRYAVPGGPPRYGTDATRFTRRGGVAAGTVRSNDADSVGERFTDHGGIANPPIIRPAQT